MNCSRTRWWMGPPHQQSVAEREGDAARVKICEEKLFAPWWRLLKVR